MRSVTHGSQSPRRRVLTVAVVLLCVLVAGGCGIRAKKADAELLRGAADRVAAQKTANAQFGFSFRIVDMPQSGGAAEINIAGLQQSQEGARSSELSAPLVLDYSRKAVQASLPAADADQPAIPFQIFAGDTIYQRRVNQSGEGTTSGRDWVKLTFGDHYEDRDNKEAQGFGSQTLNPAWLVDLLRGSLMGSIERLGTETIRDTQTSRYRVNFSWDDTFEDVSDRELEGWLTAQAMMGIPDKVVKGEVWLDDDGLPRRIKANVRQVRDRNEELEVRYTLELFDFGADIDLALPPDDQVSEVDGLGAIVQATNPLGALEGSDS